MGYLRTQAERDEVKRKFKVHADAICNRCDQPIVGLVYVDPKGGYYPKPAGTPDFLPEKPKVTYDRDCSDIVFKRKPKAQAAPTPAPVSKQQTKQSSVGAVKNVQAVGKSAKKLGQKILDLLNANRKKQWKVADVRGTLQSAHSSSQIREALNFLWAGHFLVRERGGIQAVRGKAISIP